MILNVLLKHSFSVETKLMIKVKGQRLVLRLFWPKKYKQRKSLSNGLHCVRRCQDRDESPHGTPGTRRHTVHVAMMSGGEMQ